jgi:hypothetical protein
LATQLYQKEETHLKAIETGGRNIPIHLIARAPNVLLGELRRHFIAVLLPEGRK